MNSIIEPEKRDKKHKHGNLAKKYINKGVVPEEAAVLGLLELSSGRKLQKIAMNKQASDYNDILHFMHNYKLNKSGHITEIWLYSREPLLDIFPEQICKLNYLEELYLPQNDIKFIPKKIGKLKMLKKLDLYGNRISKLPKSLKNLKNLEELSINDNKIEEIPKSVKKILKKNKKEKKPINLYKKKLRKHEFRSISETYEYHDVNGNRYILENEMIEYIPIKPSQSSCGFYDGGDYVKKEIGKIMNSNIRAMFSEAINNEACHIKNRVKMSGMLIVKENDNEEVYIISPNSEELYWIEKLLHIVI